MQTLRSVTKSRASRWLGAAVALSVGFCVSVPTIRARLWRPDSTARLAGAADSLRYRTVEARLSGGFEHRALRARHPPDGDARALDAIREATAELLQQGRSGQAADHGRTAVAGLLILGRTEDAAMSLAEALRRESGEADVLAAIRQSRDPALLADFSAVALQRAAERNDARELLLSFEASDRAWRLRRSPEAAWNRALAAGRLGLPALAADGWWEAAALEKSPGWAAEANERAAAEARLAAAVPDESAEGFFQRELIARTAASLTGTQPSDSEIQRIELVPEDHLASDTAASLTRLSPAEKHRAVAALASYTRGCNAFENDHLEDARRAFALAEGELAALRIPLALLARDRRIRSECSQSHPGCLASIRAFQTDLGASKRYPWLEARAIYAEGQTFYRRGRIYDAAEVLEHARGAFDRLHDTASVGVMHTLLANVFTTGGEPDLALPHYLGAIAIRSPQSGDRRRRQLEDVISFMLRHGYLSTAGALFDELAASPATDAGRVIESTLRGILAARLGDRGGAGLHFDRAHALLDRVDKDLRPDMQMIVAVGEAGSRTDSPHPILGQIDAAIAQHQDVDQAVWMPQLLAERGAALERANVPAHAERDYVHAIEILEKRKPNIDQMLIGYGVASDSESPFDRAIRLLLWQGRIVDALAIAQRATALRISALYAPGVGLRDVFSAAREPVKGDTVASIRRTLGPDQVAIVYHLLRDQLVTWVITNREVFAVRRSVRARDAIHRVDAFRECAGRRGCRDAGNGVSNLLLRDWIEHVPREATLLIQAPSELQGVPFSMLQTRAGERLLARNPATTAPSLRAFLRTAAVDAKRAAFTGTYFAAAPHPGGDLATLPLASAEVRQAARFYERPLVDTEARRATFVEQSPSYALVHFAGHVIVNDQQPLLSALIFDGAERLYVHEIGKQTFAHARLVVLSGCETGRSPRPTMSVAHALLSQGVPSVVYTLWPVSDETAEAFAVVFHREIAAGVTRADAVRHAQKELMRQDPERGEGWGAFALAGTPGSMVGERASSGLSHTRGQGGRS